MGKLRDDAATEYLTKLRQLTSRADVDATTFNTVRAFVEGLDKQLADDSNTVIVLGPDQYRGLQWALGLLAAYDELTKELRHRTAGGFVRTIIDDDPDIAEQERVGSLTEC